MCPREVACGLLAVTGWLLIFAAGIIVPTQPYRTQVTSMPFSLASITAWLIILCCYTITNLALLSFLAAMAGEFSRRTMTAALRVPGTPVASPLFRVIARYSTAGIRGFVTYLLVVSGLVVITTDAITNAGQADYLRFGALVSVISFVAGYEITTFRRVLTRITGFLSNASTTPGDPH